MSRILFVLLLGVAALPVAAQGLYMPRMVKDAFENGTRSPDGKPAAGYWQNYGRYNITVTAMPPDRNVVGSEQITYINNSPDTLKYLVFKVLLNIHKPGAPRGGSAGADYLTDGVQIDGFKVNGRAVPWNNNPSLYTWQPVRLPVLLAPHDSVSMDLDWHYEISLKSNREGMIDSTTYFLAYFYPRVAVYDDYNGWDMIDFVDQQEFYSDFNDYTVSVKVPANYIVWGTGTLLNPDEVLQPAIASRYKKSLQQDEVVNVATYKEVMAHQVTAQQPVNTWKWKVADIPDVAYALSDHFVWDASSVVVDDATGRRASAQAAYNDTAEDYHYMSGYARHALNWFSHNWPAVPYPYEKTTVVQGYAGMEYPMMANDETYADTNFSRFVAEHEIAHTYFPFYMGINESRYAFMDEGWATTLEYLINQHDMGPENASLLFQQFRVNGWSLGRSVGQDLPIVTPADLLRGAAYGNNAYGKAALGYLAVKDMLGDDLFKKCLHGYMDRWHGKHPLPWDFFNSFNDISGQDLNWFWNNWFFSNGYVDLAMGTVKAGKKEYAVTVLNHGGYACPFDMVVAYTDGSKETFHQTSAIWKSNPKEATVRVKPAHAVQSISLEGGIYVDAKAADNRWTASK